MVLPESWGSAMSRKKQRPEPAQYTFHLERPTVPPASSTRIVGFVDAATRAIRREAKERLKASGIFEVSRTDRRK